MATLYISEFKGLLAAVPVVQAPPLAEQTVAIGASSSVSATVNSGTNIIQLHPDVACSVSFSEGTPIATVTSMRLAAGSTQYFGIAAGRSLKIAVIANS